MLKLSELQSCLSNPLYRIYLDRVVVEDITVRDGQVEIQTEQSEQHTFPDQELRNDTPGSGCVMTYEITSVSGVKMSLHVTVEAATDLNSWLFQFKPSVTSTETNLTKEKTMPSTQKETKNESLLGKLKQDVEYYGLIKLSTMLEVTKSCGGHVMLSGQFCNFKQWCHLFEARVSKFQEVPTTFNDQPVELKAYQRQCNFGFSTSVKTVTGHHREILFLSIDKDIALELDKIIASKGLSTLDKTPDQTELVQQLQKRLDELEKTVADLKKESTGMVKPFKFSDLFDHISSTTGYRIYLGDNEITGYHNTPVSGIVLYDGKRLVAEFDNQQLIPLEHPSTGLMSYNVLATDGEYYNLRVTGYHVANEEEFFSK